MIRETLNDFKARIKGIPTKNLKKMRYHGYFYGSMEIVRLQNQKETAIREELNTREHIGTPKEERQLRGKRKRNGGMKR